MSRMIIACACDEHYGGDALKCAQSIAAGTKTPCACECHQAEACIVMPMALVRKLYSVLAPFAHQAEIIEANDKLDHPQWVTMTACGIVYRYREWTIKAQQMDDGYIRHLVQCLENYIAWMHANHSRCEQ